MTDQYIDELKTITTEAQCRLIIACRKYNLCDDISQRADLLREIDAAEAEHDRLKKLLDQATQPFWDNLFNDC